jgi:hypothetical protein
MRRRALFVAAPSGSPDTGMGERRVGSTSATIAEMVRTEIAFSIMFRLRESGERRGMRPTSIL